MRNGCTCQFVNLNNFPAYNSVKLFPSFSRYLPPSKYGVNNSSNAECNIALTATTPTPPAPDSPVLAGEFNDPEIRDEVSFVVPVEDEEETRKNSCALRSETSLLVEE